MTTTPTSGAADLLDLIEAYAEARHRQGHSSYNGQTAAARQAVKDTLAAAFGGCPACGSKQCVSGECSRPTPDMMGIINGLADRAAQADSVLYDPKAKAAESVPAVEREQERIAFKDAHRHLELYEVPDAWGRPMFKHSHVEASWLGWIARASHGQAPAETGNSVSAQADSVQEDAARLDWLLLRVSGAEFRRIGVHYSGNARRADVDAARKQGGAT